jgi:uncharacterized protein YqkB
MPRIWNFLSGKYSLILLLALYSMTGLGQPEEVNRIELPLEGEENLFQILPADNAGFVLYRKKPAEELSEIIMYEFLLYDSALEKTSSKLFKTEYIFKIVTADYERGYAYFLFEAFKNFTKQCFILKISMDGKESDQILIDTFFPDYVNYFEVYRDIMIIGGQDKMKPSVMYYNLNNNRTIVLQGIYNKRSDVLDMHMDKENEVFTVLSTFRNHKGQTSINLRSYDREGLPIEDTRIDPEGDRNFTKARAMIINNQLRVVAGTYRYRKAAFDEGIFVTTIRFDGEQKTQFYPFLEVLELLDSLKTRQGLSVTSNDVKKEILSYDWEVTKCRDAGLDNVIIVESGQKVKTKELVNMVNEFYAYNRALVIGFDDQMEMIWLNDFDLKYLQSADWRQWIDVEPKEDYYRLTGFYHHSILEKRIHKSATLNNIKYYSLIYNEETMSTPVNINNEICELKTWYGGYSLYTGMKQYDVGVERNYIYYVEKIRF